MGISPRFGNIAFIFGNIADNALSARSRPHGDAQACVPATQRILRVELVICRENKRPSQRVCSKQVRSIRPIRAMHPMRCMRMLRSWTPLHRSDANGHTGQPLHMEVRLATVLRQIPANRSMRARRTAWHAHAGLIVQPWQGVGAQRSSSRCSFFGAIPVVVGVVSCVVCCDGYALLAVLLSHREEAVNQLLVGTATPRVVALIVVVLVLSLRLTANGTAPCGCAADCGVRLVLCRCCAVAGRGEAKHCTAR